MHGTDAELLMEGRAHGPHDVGQCQYVRRLVAIQVIIEFRHSGRAFRLYDEHIGNVVAWLLGHRIVVSALLQRGRLVKYGCAVHCGEQHFACTNQQLQELFWCYGTIVNAFDLHEGVMLSHF